MKSRSLAPAIERPKNKEVLSNPALRILTKYRHLKGSLYICSKFNPLNTDTPLIRTLSMAPSVTVLTGLDCIWEGQCCCVISTGKGVAILPGALWWKTRREDYVPFTFNGREFWLLFTLNISTRSLMGRKSAGSASWFHIDMIPCRETDFLFSLNYVCHIRK